MQINSTYVIAHVNARSVKKETALDMLCELRAKEGYMDCIIIKHYISGGNN